MPTQASSTSSSASFRASAPRYHTSSSTVAGAREPNRRLVAPAHERRDGLSTGSARAVEPLPGDTSTAPTFGRMRLRNTFSITSRGSTDGREHHLVTTPKRGPERRRAREAILTVLHRAERQHHRVLILLTLGDYTQLRIGPSSGYDPAVALVQCRSQGDDPFEWCAREHLRQHAELVRADTIIGVQLETWLPPARPRSSRPTR